MAGYIVINVGILSTTYKTIWRLTSKLQCEVIPHIEAVLEHDNKLQDGRCACAACPRGQHATRQVGRVRGNILKNFFGRKKNMFV